MYKPELDELFYYLPSRFPDAALVIVLQARQRNHQRQVIGAAGPQTGVTVSRAILYHNVIRSSSAC